MPGFALHRELELDVQAGIPASKVLQNATLNAAQIMHLDKDLGSISPGKLADLTLVTGDPAANIGDIRRTALLMKDGILYTPRLVWRGNPNSPQKLRCVRQVVLRQRGIQAYWLSI
jgi:imidazolonepropionase-like amidohydrolase